MRLVRWLSALDRITLDALECRLGPVAGSIILIIVLLAQNLN